MINLLRHSMRKWSLTLVLTALGGCSASPPPCPESPIVPVGLTQTPALPEASDSRAAPLELWTEGTTRQAIIDFVESVTTAGGKDFVPPEERIAVFDNDGTLWSEQPLYVQLAFTLDRLRQLSEEHPEWKTKQPYKAALEGDLETLAKAGPADLLKLVTATHAGMSAEEFDRLARDWLKTARSPKYDLPYTELTFSPMVELLAYLRAHGFKTFIVSGGGTSFMRPWTEAVYGIPPEQVIGSRFHASYRDEGSGPFIQREAEVDFIDDGPGKPVGIYHAIGRRPILAAGNSDGDLQMLQWTQAGEGPRLALLVHHTDDEREVAYDRASAMGKLDKALAVAATEGWQVIDIKKDWKQVFAFQTPRAVTNNESTPAPAVDSQQAETSPHP